MKDKIIKSDIGMIGEDKRGAYKICPVCKEKFYKTEFITNYSFNMKKFCGYFCLQQDRKERRKKVKRNGK
jgi:hypothetical protein